MRSSRRLSHGFAAAKGRWMRTNHREGSAMALPTRKRIRTESGETSRMLSQGLASTDRREGICTATAQPRPCRRQTSAVCSGGAGYPPRSRGVFVSLSCAGTAAWWKVQGGKTPASRCACIMQWWPVPVRRCGWAADDTGLTGVSLSIGQGVDSSALRASEFQFQFQSWQEAKRSCLQVAGLTEGPRLALASGAQ
jgi:hypothetical protein